MSSITVGELRERLKEYPDDYEVIMEWHWKEKNQIGDIISKNSIAMINAIGRNDGYREIRLLN